MPVSSTYIPLSICTRWATRPRALSFDDDPGAVARPPRGILARRSSWLTRVTILVLWRLHLALAAELPASDPTDPAAACRASVANDPNLLALFVTVTPRPGYEGDNVDTCWRASLAGGRGHGLRRAAVAFASSKNLEGGPCPYKDMRCITDKLCEALLEGRADVDVSPSDPCRLVGGGLIDDEKLALWPQRSRRDVLLVQRIFKTASYAFQHRTRLIGALRGFTVQPLDEWECPPGSDAGAGEEGRGAVFAGHFAFPDPKALYPGPDVRADLVAMVRHPLSRRLSLYSYERHPNQQVWDAANLAARRAREEEDPCGCGPDVAFGDCVLRAAAKNKDTPHACDWPTSSALYLGHSASESLVAMLCGTDAACTDPARLGEAFGRATRHLREDYTFVGLKEQFDLSFAILRQLLPRWYDDSFGLMEGEAYAPLPFAHMNAQTRDPATAVGGLTQDIPWAAVQVLLEQPGNRFELAIYDEAVRLFWKHAEAVGVG